MTDIEREFEEEFWPNVPRGHKIGRGLARRAYVKARQTASKAEILGGLPGYARYEFGRQSRSRGDFRPLHPATWLNQERWTDDIPVKSTVTAAETMPPCACGCGRQAKKANFYDGKYWHVTACWANSKKTS